ncbi:MAG: VOC family protein [Candidatus Margulisbacteria bacterium]|jgi:PhnB protein|nr:VOC family protein [Candidatus Margulisiibacteriota bacterium]
MTNFAGLEVDFCVPDTLEAMELYSKVFGAETLEKTALEKGLNEVVFTILGSRFHMLDENPEAGLHAPRAGQTVSIWFNLVVADIKEVYAKALSSGFSVVMEIVIMKARGLRTAMVKDPFGHIWQLHQIDKEA